MCSCADRLTHNFGEVFLVPFISLLPRYGYYRRHHQYDFIFPGSNLLLLLGFSKSITNPGGERGVGFLL